MKMKIEKKILYEKVSSAMGSVASKGSLASTEGILLDASSEGICKLCSYDLEKGYRAEMKAEIEEKGSYIISADKFNQIVKTMPDGIITIEVDDRNIAKISCGRSEFEINVMDGKDFPGIPELTGDVGFNIEQSVLREMISKTSFAVAQNDNRPALNGSFFKIDGNKITIVSCDGNRLALKKQNCNLENTDSSDKEINISFIIPGKTLSELMKLISDTDDRLTLTLSRKHVIFSIDNDFFFSRLIDAEYIDYERFIPKANRTFVKIDCLAFIKCLERASLVTEDKSMGQTKSAVKCSFCENMLKITSNSASGKVYDEMSIEKEGSDLDIGFNCRYLLDALRATGVEKLKISMSSSLMSMIIEANDDNDNDNDNADNKEDYFLFLVLPMKI